MTFPRTVLPSRTCESCGVSVAATTPLCKECKAGTVMGTTVVLKTWTSGEGRKFKETGEFRRAVTGEFILAPLGVAQANNLTRDKFRILREIQ